MMKIELILNSISIKSDVNKNTPTRKPFVYNKISSINVRRSRLILDFLNKSIKKKFIM